MKSFILRKLDEILLNTGFLRRNGSGNLFLADNGLYLSAMGNATLAVKEHIATTDNQIFDIKVEGGYVYVINSSSYKGIKVSLSTPSVGTQCTIKNTHASQPITFTTQIDGIDKFVLDSHNAITVVYLTTGWVILQDYLISYDLKNSVNKSLVDIKNDNGIIVPVDIDKSFTVADTDNRKFFNCKGNFTVYLPNATVIPTGFNVYVKNASDGIITVSVSIADQKIDDETYKEVYPNECMQIICAADKYVTSTTAAWIAPDAK